MFRKILVIIVLIFLNIGSAFSQELKFENMYYLKSFGEMCDILVLESYDEIGNKYNIKPAADDVFMFEPSMSSLIEKELKDLEGVAKISSLISLTLTQSNEVKIKDIKVRVKLFSEQAAGNLEIAIQKKIERILRSCKITQLIARSGKENFAFGMIFISKEEGNDSASMIDEQIKKHDDKYR